MNSLKIIAKTDFYMSQKLHLFLHDAILELFIVNFLAEIG